ncbi:MAG TPA: hypothetical protein VKI65_04695 [Gemmataceae bacterium]|nr:hypothetical protein [Gemmataceae bacterium]
MQQVWQVAKVPRIPSRREFRRSRQDCQRQRRADRSHASPRPLHEPWLQHASIQQLFQNWRGDGCRENYQEPFRRHDLRPAQLFERMSFRRGVRQGLVAQVHGDVESKHERRQDEPYQEAHEHIDAQPVHGQTELIRAGPHLAVKKEKDKAYLEQKGQRHGPQAFADRQQSAAQLG